jgi:hypothetical protein
MAKDHDLTRIAADLASLSELLDGTDTGVAALCLKIARMELLMKIHNVADEEFRAICDQMESTLAAHGLDAAQ